MPSKNKKKRDPIEVAQHTVKLPIPLNTRVHACMQLEGIQSFADFTRSALSRRCLEIERFHATPPSS